MITNPWQVKMWAWLQRVFPDLEVDSVSSRRERSFRFCEEAVELVQAAGISKDEVLKIVDYVYSRPIGVLYQEVGGVGLTFAAFCASHSVSSEQAMQREFERIDNDEFYVRVRNKDLSKKLGME